MLNKVKIAGATALLTLSVGAQANIIDLFTDFQYVTTHGQLGASGATDYSEAGSSLDIIGGYRSLEITETLDIGSVGAQPLHSSDILVDSGILTFSSDNNVTSLGTIQYDGNDMSSALTKTGMQVGGIGENLVQQVGCPTGGCDRFIFDVLTADQNWDFTIGIYTDDTHWTEFDLEAVAGTHYSEIFFSFFEDAVGCGLVGSPPLPTGVSAQRCGGAGVADMTNVGAIQLVFNINDTTAVDFSIGAITKTGIPEPSMVALLGLGLASSGLVSIRRRRKEKALLAA